MSDKTYIVLGIVYAVVAVILIGLVLVLINKHNRKKYNSILLILERDKNLILSANILTELNKVASLINNVELEQKYKIWKNRYNQIKEVDIPSLNKKLNDLDELIKTKKYKEADKAAAKLELEIYYVKAKSEFLLKEIKEISLSESKNREIVTNLKREYRDIYLKYNNQIDDYKIIKVPIELQFENIDKLFSSFEIAMENNDYSEAPKIVKALGDVIGNIKIVIDEAPSIILMGKKLIPNKIEDIKNIYSKMIKAGYVLDYLNVDYNITEAEKKIADIFDRLKVLNLTDSVVELRTILEYFEGLYSDFDNEKASKKAYEENARKIAIKCKKLLAIIKKMSSKIEDIKYSYDLTDDDVKIIDELNLSIKGILNDYEIIVEKFRSHLLPYSKLNKELEVLNMKLVGNEERLELTIKKLSSLKDDELRAREQLDEIRRILKDSKEKIKSFKLPVIPKRYYVELSEANDALDAMIDELNKRPISIRILNTRVDTARDLVLKLYKTTSEVVKNASLAEKTIVYGNRYRTTNKMDMALRKAEGLFFSGQYKESLEISIDAVADVEPGIHEKIREVLKEGE
jgi:septation ring formation regulator